MISSILCRNILTFGQRVSFSRFRAHGQAVPLLTVFLFPITFFLSCRSSSSCCVRNSRSCCWRFASSWAWTLAFSLCSNVEEMYFASLKATRSHRQSKSVNRQSKSLTSKSTGVCCSFFCLSSCFNPRRFSSFFPFTCWAFASDSCCSWASCFLCSSSLSLIQDVYWCHWTPQTSFLYGVIYYKNKNNLPFFFLMFLFLFFLSASLTSALCQ